MYDDGPEDCYYYRVRFSPASPFDPNLRSRAHARMRIQEQLEHQRYLLSDAEEALAEGISLADIEEIAENEYGFGSLEELRAANDSLVSQLAGGVCDVSSRLQIRFYDEAGFSLYLDKFAGSESRNALSPGWNDVPDEVTRSDGDWIWVGRFGAEVLAPSQFERLSTISVRLVPPDGCP